MTAITVRNVPAQVRDELASRAARSGRSLQEYLLQHLVEVASRPSLDDAIMQARQRAARIGTVLDTESLVADRDADRR